MSAADAMMLLLSGSSVKVKAARARAVKAKVVRAKVVRAKVGVRKVQVIRPRWQPDSSKNLTRMVIKH